MIRLLERISTVVKHIVVASLIILPAFASAATLKISTAYPDGTTVLKEFRAAGKLIEQESEGRVKIKFYPGGVMGDDRAVQRKIRIGQLHGAIIQSGSLASAYKNSQIYNAPMLFRSYEEVDYVRAKLDGQFDQGFLGGGWKTFGLMEGGFAYLMSVNPVASDEDLKQQKFWIPANDPISEKISNAFGLSPIVLNFGEVKTSLETGAINAIAAPPVAAISMQWFTRLEYLTDVPFMYTAGTLAMDAKHYTRLSAQDQEIVDRIFRQAITNLDKLNRTDNLKAFEALLNQGIQTVEIDEQKRDALEEQAMLANQKLIEQGEFSQQIYDQVNGWLDEFRAQ